MNDSPTAADLVSQRYLTIGEQATLREAIAVLMDERATAEGEHTFVVTREDGSYAGLLSLRRFLVGLFGNWNLDVRSAEGELEQALRDRLDMKVADVVERNRPQLTLGTPLLEVIPKMVDPEFECLPVLEHGVIKGVVYVADVFRLASTLALTPETSGIRVEKHGE